MKNLIEELRWRGLIHQEIPGTEQHLLEGKKIGYVGFDPTAPSLHVGNLIALMLLRHLFINGHSPIALIGFATAMVGDPSGKTSERDQLSEEILTKNSLSLIGQIYKILTEVTIVNNLQWFKDVNLLEFLRTTGKILTVNYMMGKDSVKSRIEGEGMSFTEFSYQLMQATDFQHLNKVLDCTLQMGGSDQWGNITTGCELIRKTSGNKVFAFTTPLITKSDGTKFGKSESGNIWLDKDLTSYYEFYQFWKRVTDVDAEKYIKMFTFLPKGYLDELIKACNAHDELRLQDVLAQEVTRFVHGEEGLATAECITSILHGSATKTSLKFMADDVIEDLSQQIPTSHLKMDPSVDVPIIDFLMNSSLFTSRRDARQALKENSVWINKERVPNLEDFTVGEKDIINESFILIQRGKKKYSLILITK